MVQNKRPNMLSGVKFHTIATATAEGRKNDYTVFIVCSDTEKAFTHKIQHMDDNNKNIFTMDDGSQVIVPTVANQHEWYIW